MSVLVTLSVLACTSPYDDPTEVARLYWTAMAGHDSDEAIRFSTGSVQDLDLSDFDYEVNAVELVVAEIHGSEATVPTTIDATVGGMHLAIEFETALVEVDGRWLIDIKTTTAKLVQSVASSMTGRGLYEAVEGLRGLEGLGELIEMAVSGAVEGALEGLEGVLAGSEFSDNSNWNSDNSNWNPFSGVSASGAGSGHNLSMESGWVGIDVHSFADPIVSLTRIGDDEQVSEGFTLTRAADLRVLALGEGGDDRMFDHGWIVNADTREAVWTMSLDETRHAGGGRSNRMKTDIVSMAAGSYVVHFISDGNTSYEDRWAGNSPPTHEQFWGITVMPAGDDLRPGTVTDYEAPEALVQITRVRDNATHFRTFRLQQRTRLRVYAIGEITGPGSRYDYGYIVDARTGSRVWQMEYSQTEWAGGRDSDRVVNTVITLPAGNYTLHYESDGSHSYRDFEGFDRDAWGITLYEVDGQ